jgi:hypothetical protein
MGFATGVVASMVERTEQKKKAGRELVEATRKAVK